MERQLFKEMHYLKIHMSVKLKYILFNSHGVDTNNMLERAQKSSS